MTLDGVDERRKGECFGCTFGKVALWKDADGFVDLPRPDLKISKPSRPEEQERPQSAVGADAPATPSKLQQKQPASVKANTRKQSFGTLEADPWNSPDLHRGHAHQNQAPATNGLHPPNGTQRTTSSFTTSEQRTPMPVNEPAAPPQASTGSYGSGWGGDTTTAEEGFSHQGMSGGFGGDAPAGEISGNANGPRRAIGGGRVSRGAEEVVTVTAIQEKEGVFLFQHRNYEVASARRNSKVIRRYSDFVWLLDCLHKRYPFRQLPLLPPKRVASTLPIPILRLHGRTNETQSTATT